MAAAASVAREAVRALAAVDEASLEEILDGLRAALAEPTSAAAVSSRHRHSGRLKPTHLPELDLVAARHFRDTQVATLSVSGRSLPLIYKLVASLLSPPQLQVVVLLDVDDRFDATCLSCPLEHLSHLYVYHPSSASPDLLRSLVAEAESFLLYDAGAAASRLRHWWGTVVIGGLGAGDVTASWKGWLRVQHRPHPPLTSYLSLEEALEQRSRWHEAVEAAPWVASSDWGGFVFSD